MTNIRPVSDLRNNFNNISKQCHDGREPVFITKNGIGDMVVMSVAHFESMQAKIELYRKLLEAETAAENPARVSHSEVMARLSRKVNVKK